MKLHFYWIDAHWRQYGKGCAENYNLIVDMEEKTYTRYINSYYDYYQPNDIEVKRKSDIGYFIEYLKANDFKEITI